MLCLRFTNFLKSLINPKVRLPLIYLSALQEAVAIDHFELYLVSTDVCNTYQSMNGICDINSATPTAIVNPS